MAITHNFVTLGSIDSAASISIPVVVGAGENIAALIGLTWAPVIEATTTSVTFAAQSATFIQLAASGAGIVEQYYVKGITAGSRVLAATWDGTVVAVMAIEVMNGVDQTTPLGVINTNSGTSTTASATLTLTTAGNWLVDTVIVARPTLTNLTPDPTQTSRWFFTAGTAPTQLIGAGSTEESAGGTQTQQWSISPSRFWAYAVAEFRAAATGKPVNVSTSYNYGADPLPLESFKDPAVQQRIWVNDRRYMQGDS